MPLVVDGPKNPLHGVGNTEWQVGEPGEEQAHHAHDAGEATGRRRGLSAQGLAQVSLQTSGWPTASIKKYIAICSNFASFQKYTQSYLTSHKNVKHLHGQNPVQLIF
jgi:hypothetical protein